MDKKSLLIEKVVYGKTILYRRWCPKCEDYDMSVKQYAKCECGFEFKKAEESRIVIVCEPKRRRYWTKKFRDEIIKKQDNRCYWCGRFFGDHIYRNNKIIKLKMHFDHILPYVIYKDNNEENICASCNICNNFKHAKCFENEKECRNYLFDRWERDINLGKIEEIRESLPAEPKHIFCSKAVQPAILDMNDEFSWTCQ